MNSHEGKDTSKDTRQNVFFPLLQYTELQGFPSRTLHFLLNSPLIERLGTIVSPKGEILINKSPTTSLIT